MSFIVKRYSGVEGKKVSCIETTSEQDFVYVHVRFTDKTVLSFSLIGGVTLHHVGLYDGRTSDLKVLRDYVRPKHPR